MEPCYQQVNLPLLPIQNFISTKGWEVRSHWHDETELLYIRKGKVRLITDRNYFQAGSGDLIYISGGQIHSINSIDGKGWEIEVLQWSPVYFAGKPPKFSVPYAINSRIPEGKFVLDLFMRIQRELTEKKIGYENAVQSTVCGLYAMLQRNFKTTGCEESHAKTVLKDTFALVKNRYHEEITLAEAASASHLSVSQFTRLFKRQTGTTFFQYLQSYRIDCAERILKEGGSVTEAAFACGFGSTSSLNRAYHKWKGYSPSVDRQRIQ